ncbi:MAG TPA: hypothetical protein VF188_03545 [Longimicrobiales bacterium]
MNRPELAAALVAASAFLAGCGAGAPSDDRGATDMLAEGITSAELERRVAQFAPATIDFDAEPLESWEKQVLARLVAASDLMHEIFTLQVSPGNPELRSRLAADESDTGAAARAYFDIMVGPWDRLSHDEPFLAVGTKPAGAGYYPPDLTREALESWLASHPEDRQAFTSYFTVIRRDKGNLVAIPYAVEYRDRLEEAARLLREAATLSRNASLTNYLNLRADAFLSNDYYESDMAWMDLDSRIEPTIGPYEVYEDRLMGYKAAFESFITVADAEASAELARLKDQMRALEAELPIEDRYKNLERGFESPIRVVDVVYTAGDTRAGVQTIAFNLPNDARVREAKGSKKVMLRNVMRAKFDRILEPIAAQALAPEIREALAFRPWFIGVLMHELAHGLGPGNITLPSGAATTVNQALRDHYSAIEEAKADVTGLHNLTILARKGMYDDDFVRRAFLGHFADLFRSVRFGAGEAHGKAALLQFNYLMEKGAITYDAGTGRFSANYDRLVSANRELAHLLLTVEAEGSYRKAGELLDTYGTVHPEMQAVVDRLDGVPVDIRPDYTVKQKMQSWQ